MPTVADRIVQTLSAAGVTRVYGIVGDSLNGITSLSGKFALQHDFDEAVEFCGSVHLGTVSSTV